ncbi:hypothetical protein ACFODZ_17005 [Marinicella sediminis]|uniref:Uncharacterized protein n=1 Tax=Marinicella sediminis TaxID=1792834 RepID=A0ABV7JFR5_9GAMM|nr:hypothetical protein [Marinicella sediminis]
MTKSTIRVLLLLVSFFISKSGAQDIIGEVEELGFTNENRKYQISMYALAANPDEYNEKIVYVSGFISYAYEMRIFADKSSCTESFLVNSISLSVTKDETLDYSSKHGKCEQFNVSGTFLKINDYGKDNFEKLTIGHIDPVLTIDQN